MSGKLDRDTVYRLFNLSPEEHGAPKNAKTIDEVMAWADAETRSDLRKGGFDDAQIDAVMQRLNDLTTDLSDDLMQTMVGDIYTAIETAYPVQVKFGMVMSIIDTAALLAGDDEEEIEDAIAFEVFSTLFKANVTGRLNIINFDLCRSSWDNQERKTISIVGKPGTLMENGDVPAQGDAIILCDNAMDGEIQETDFGLGIVVSHFYGNGAHQLADYMQHNYLRTDTTLPFNGPVVQGILKQTGLYNETTKTLDDIEFEGITFVWVM
jgi:hypothetical protein